MKKNALIAAPMALMMAAMAAIGTLGAPNASAAPGDPTPTITKTVRNLAHGPVASSNDTAYPGATLIWHINIKAPAEQTGDVTYTINDSMTIEQDKVIDISGGTPVYDTNNVLTGMTVPAGGDVHIVYWSHATNTAGPDVNNATVSAPGFNDASTSAQAEKSSGDGAINASVSVKNNLDGTTTLVVRSNIEVAGDPTTPRTITLGEGFGSNTECLTYAGTTVTNATASASIIPEPMPPNVPANPNNLSCITKIPYDAAMGTSFNQPMSLTVDGNTVTSTASLEMTRPSVTKTADATQVITGNDIRWTIQVQAAPANPGTEPEIRVYRINDPMFGEQNTARQPILVDGDQNSLQFDGVNWNLYLFDGKSATIEFTTTSSADANAEINTVTVSEDNSPWAKNLPATASAVVAKDTTTPMKMVKYFVNSDINGNSKVGQWIIRGQINPLVATSAVLEDPGVHLDCHTSSDVTLTGNNITVHNDGGVPGAVSCASDPVTIDYSKGDITNTATFTINGTDYPVTGTITAPTAPTVTKSKAKVSSQTMEHFAGQPINWQVNLTPPNDKKWHTYQITDSMEMQGTPRVRRTYPDGTTQQMSNALIMDVNGKVTGIQVWGDGSVYQLIYTTYATTNKGDDINTITFDEIGVKASASATAKKSTQAAQVAKYGYIDQTTNTIKWSISGAVNKAQDMNITITDPGAGPLTCKGDPDLVNTSDANVTWNTAADMISGVFSCEATTPLDPTKAVNGVYSNTVTVNGVSATASVSVNPKNMPPTHTLDKKWVDTNGNGVMDAGDTVTFTSTLINIANDTMFPDPTTLNTPQGPVQMTCPNVGLPSPPGGNYFTAMAFGEMTPMEEQIPTLAGLTTGQPYVCTYDYVIPPDSCGANAFGTNTPYTFNPYNGGGSSSSYSRVAPREMVTPTDINIEGPTVVYPTTGSTTDLTALEVICPLPKVDIPPAPKVTDPCGADNATWQVPADTAEIIWGVNSAGHLVAVVANGSTFTDGATTHDYGVAPETNKDACPVPVPLQIPIPAAPSVTDPCDAGNATWDIPANTDQLVWGLDANKHLTVTTTNGLTFTDGSRVHDYGLAPETNTDTCPVPPTQTIPSTPGVIDPCGTGNATWSVPADTTYLTWGVNAKGELIATSVGMTFNDGTTTHNYGVAPETNTEACPVPVPETIPVPSTPAVTDPCGTGNASWVIPTTTDTIAWGLDSDKHLVARVLGDKTFDDGSRVHDYGLAPENNTEACPVPVVPKAEIPAAPGVTDPCGTGNAVWDIPADTPELLWGVNAKGELTVALRNGSQFTDGTTSHNYGVAKETNTEACPTPEPTPTPTPTPTPEPKKVDLPSAPAVDDPCGKDNAAWKEPAGDDQIGWLVTRDGHLFAYTKQGVFFSDGSTIHDYGIAVEKNTQACPTTEPTPTPTPKPTPEPKPEPTVTPNPTPTPEPKPAPSPSTVPTTSSTPSEVGKGEPKTQPVEQDHPGLAKTGASTSVGILAAALLSLIVGATLVRRGRRQDN